MKCHRGRLTALLCGAVLWLISVLYQGLPQASNTKEWFLILSNGALIPGVLFVGISGMMWVAGEGLFDGIKYSMSSLMARMRGHEKRYATYYDYTRREKKEAPSFPMLFPGLTFLAAAVILTLLYHLY